MSQTILAQKDRPLTILVVGDSLSSGYLLQNDQSWVSIMKNKMIDTSVKNASTSGATTSNGLQILSFQLQKNKYDIVIIALGGNDFLRGIALQSTEENFNGMLSMISEHSAQAAIFAIPFFPNYGEPYLKKIAMMYKRLAVKHQAHLLKNFIQPVAGKFEYQLEDGIHFNKEAQPLIADYVFDFLMRSFLIK